MTDETASQGHVQGEERCDYCGLRNPGPEHRNYAPALCAEKRVDRRAEPPVPAPSDPCACGHVRRVHGPHLGCHGVDCQCKEFVPAAVPAPSDEAINAALKAADPLGAEMARARARLLPGAKRALNAAYAIDLPRVRAEERAATLRAILDALREHRAMGRDYRANPDALLPPDVFIARKFNPEAEG